MKKNKLYGVFALLAALTFAGCVDQITEDCYILNRINEISIDAIDQKVFSPREEHIISYTLSEEADVFVSGIPETWTVFHDKAAKTITISAPPQFISFLGGELLLSARKGNAVAFKTIYIGAKLGAPVYNNEGRIMGFVIREKSEGDSGLVFGRRPYYTSSKWGQSGRTHVITDKDNGLQNTFKIINMFPVGEGFSTEYTAMHDCLVSAAEMNLYMPAINELSWAIKELKKQTENYDYHILGLNGIWSSTEHETDMDFAYSCDLDGNINKTAKSVNNFNAAHILKF